MAHILFKIFETCNFQQYHCGAVVVAIYFVLLSETRRGKKHEFVVALSRDFKKKYDVELVLPLDVLTNFQSSTCSQRI